MQTVSMPASCIFCRIVAGEAPSYIVAEDDATVAFLDLGQATPGHTLVVPRTHAPDIWAISDGDLAAVSATAKRVAHLVDDRLGPDGITLVQTNRVAGWQSVFHFHLQVIPRWHGDGLRPPWDEDRPPSDERAAILDRLLARD